MSEQGKIKDGITLCGRNSEGNIWRIRNSRFRIQDTRCEINPISPSFPLVGNLFRKTDKPE